MRPAEIRAFMEGDNNLPAWVNRHPDIDGRNASCMVRRGVKPYFMPVSITQLEYPSIIMLRGVHCDKF